MSMMTLLSRDPIASRSCTVVRSPHSLSLFKSWGRCAGSEPREVQSHLLPCRGPSEQVEGGKGKAKHLPAR